MFERVAHEHRRDGEQPEEGETVHHPLTRRQYMCESEYRTRTDSTRTTTMPRATTARRLELVQPAAGSRRINLMFRAFSDPTRLRILHLIQSREMCVGDIVEVLRLPQPTVSRHLSYLRRAGLVRGRRDGLWVFYSLAVADTSFHRRLLGCVGTCFDDVPQIARDAKRAASIRKSGGCCPK
jgi:ArsR family transcriptional regulator